MIHEIYANKSSFQRVSLDKGLNIIVSERLEQSGNKKTTNSRGKSTLISIINFCLGSDVARSGLCADGLSGWSFTIEITLFSKRTKITREIDKPERITVEHFSSDWPIKPEYDEETGLYFIVLKKWKELLGIDLFNLPKKDNYVSFRTLISYFIRNKNEAYNDPLKTITSQANNFSRIYNTFLIGLDYKYAKQWHDIEKKSKSIEALMNSIKEGVHETAGELEAKKIDLEEKLEKSRAIISEFKVHEKYHEIQNNANEITKEVHKLTNMNISDKRKLSNYKKSISGESPPDKKNLEEIYKEIGFIFPDSVKKTLKEAMSFHDKIIKNRSAFLKAEIVRIENEINNRSDNIDRLNNERSSLMKILETHGALEEYMLLQEEHTEIKMQLEHIKNKINEIRKHTKEKNEIKSRKLELDKKATIDYGEKRELWEQAIKLFNENAKALYGTPGELIIDISDKGYKFNVSIPGGKGSGINKMKIFCYDLMTICLQKILNRKIDFLIHDSIIYEGVDERQIAHAIEQVSVKAKEYDFQYIMTVNSDTIPYEDFSEDFNFNDYIKLKLTDDSPSGSLLGIRY